MGRPSIKAKRTEEILNAFEWCVARYGVEGSTLEKIAERAGLARALIRHNIGNRDLILDKLVERILMKSKISMDQLISQLPKSNRITCLIEYMFDSQYSDTQLILVISALIIAANDRPKLADLLKSWINNFISQISLELHQFYQGEDKQKIIIAAHGITGIYFNVDSLSPLGDVTEIREHSKKAALMLISQFEK